MIKKCPICHKEFDGSSVKKYCSAKCKKTFENSQRSAPTAKQKKPSTKKYQPPSNRPQGVIPSIGENNIVKPTILNDKAAIYWDELAPILTGRGHLNILSKRILALYCDLQSRIDDIIMMLDAGSVEECQKCGAKNIIPGNRSLLQLDDKWDNKAGTETQSFKESPYSNLLRQYTARSLDYAKQLYLTPLSNRGNFGLEDEEKKDPEEEFLNG